MKEADSNILPRLAAIAIAAGLMGCVTQSRYDETVAELNEQRARADALAIEVDRLDRDRADAVQTILELGSELEQRREFLELKDEELAELRRTRRALDEALKEQIASGHIRLEQMRDGLRVALAEEILFPSGSAELNASGLEVLQTVSEELLQNPYSVFVYGHTDNVPIGPRLANRFPSNWELGAARAARVVRLFQSKGIEGRRLIASSYGPNRPTASNSDSAGRAQNRRIEIRLRPVEIAE